VGEREARLATRLAWVLALVMAAALTAVALGPHRIGDYSTETDFYGAYADGARGIQKGHLDPGRYGVVGPGYEVALALVGALAPDLFAAAETISILATVTTLLLWFHLLRRRADARLALLAALFMAVNPHFFRFGYTASTDALALSLQAAALFLLLAMPGWRTAAVAGVVAAAAFLTRYSAVVLLPVGLLAAAGGGRPVRRGAAGVAAPRASSRRADTVAFAAGFLLPVAAWVAYGLSQGGGAPSQLHHNLAFEVFARARGIPWDVYQRDLQPRFTSLRDVIAYDPAAVGLRLAINSVDHLREDARLLLGWPTAACVALGALLAARGGALRRQWPLALAAGLSFAAFVPAFHSERYSLALLPYYAASAAALFASPRWALVLGSRVWLKPALAAVPLGLALAGSLDLQRRILAQQPTEALACAQTLRSLAAPGDRVLVRKPHVAYLAGVESVAFPFADSLPQLAAYARRHGARWMLIGLGEIEMRPAFRYLLDTSGVVPGLTPRRVTGPRPAVLYQIGPEFGEIPAWFDNDTLAALHDARAAAMAFPLEAGHLRRAGTIELARGEFVAAREHLERAADLAPSDPEVLLPLGEALMRTGALELAGIAYARAEQAAPGNVQARIGRGWVSLLGGRPREAAELWRPVVRVTDSPATLEQMLALYRSLGDREAAAAAEARLRQRGR
jgi:tetratricopeptide (TPR) repeat protein